jgi:hypothetical protein
MNDLWMAAILVTGVIAAVKLTKWVNWFTYGENRQRREKNRNPRQE